MEKEKTKEKKFVKFLEAGEIPTQELSIQERIVIVQNELKVPKEKFNSYANFKYRSLEDILEAVKPLLKEQNLLMTISDEPIHIEGRFWIKANVCIQDFASEDNYFEVSGYAREAESKTKMDDAQVTGMASTYARKYALNGLFLIDDNQDPDDMKPEIKKPEVAKPEAEEITEKVKKGDDVLASRLRIKIKNRILLEDLEAMKQEIADAGSVLNKEQFESVITEAKKKKEQLQGVEISDEELNNLDFSK